MTASVHILHHGLPLCEFTMEIPATWPAGHTWVSLREIQEGYAPPNRCAACWAKVIGPGGNTTAMSTAYFVQCLECDWARRYGGKRPWPTVPHAAHFIETGHDKINHGVEAPPDTPYFTIAEWGTAVTFSAGVQYGGIHTARTIKAKVLKALPDADHLAPGRERDVHTLEQVEAYKRDVAQSREVEHLKDGEYLGCKFCKGPTVRPAFDESTQMWTVSCYACCSAGPPRSTESDALKAWGELPPP